MSLDVNWSVFEPQEREGIEKLLDMRMPEHIASLIINMDRAKEAELQKIISQVRPLNSLNENTLREKIIGEYYKKNPRGPQSPAEEKELQDELDEELRKYHAEQQRKAQEQIDLLEGIKKEEVKPFCNQCDSKGVRHKRECPINKSSDETILPQVLNNTI